MNKFLLIIFIPLSLFAVEDYDGNLDVFSLDSQQAFVYSLKVDSPKVLLLHNLGGDSYVDFSINAEKKYAASWMGNHGYYLIYLPPSKDKYLLNIHKLDSQDNQSKIGINEIDLSDAHLNTLKAFQYLSHASNLRYRQYMGGTDNRKEALQLLNASQNIFKLNNLYFFAAITAYEQGIIFTELNKQRESIQYFNLAIKYWGNPIFKIQQLKSLNMKGLVYWKISQLSKALDIFNQLLKAYHEIGKYDLEAMALNNIGLVYWDKNEVNKAKDFYIKSLEIYHININNLDQIPVSKPIAATLNNLALCYDVLGEPDTAELIWQTHLKKFKNISNSSSLAKAKNNLASLYINKGQYDLSKQLLDESITLFEKTNNKKWLSLSLYNSGRLYHRLGLNKLAEIQLLKSIAVVDIKNNPKDIIKPQMELMKMYTSLDQNSKSALFKNKILQIAKQVNNKQIIALLYLNKFHIDLSSNEYKNAENDISQAISISKNTDYQRIVSNVLINQSKLFLMQGKAQQAINILKVETQKLKNIWETQLLNLANNLLAQAYINMGELNHAETTIKNEMKNLNFYMSLTNNNNIRLNLNHMLNETLSIYNIISSLQSKSTLGFIKTNQVLANFKRYSNKTVSQSKIKSNGINNLLSTINSKTLALENSKLSLDDRKHIQNNIIELKAQLDFSYTSSQNTTIDEVKIQEIQNNLDDETLVIQYSTGNAGSVSWWITKNKFESFVLDNKRKLNQLVNLSHEEFIQKKPTYQNIKELSNKLLEPMINYKNIKRIRLVLDDPLNLVPFDALLDPRFDSKQVLSDTTLIQRYTSIKSTFRNQRLPDINPHDKSVLIIADPVTATNDSRLKNHIDKSDSLSYSRLVGSQNEAKNISQFFKSNILQGFDANKENVINQGFSKNNVIHIATHAFFHPEIPGLSSIVLSNYQANGKKTQSSYLRALDISSMKNDAELIVLSGCETGVNQYDNSLGLSGLTQSFIQAGSHNLIASLWQVDDRSTEKIMTEFYKNYSHGLSIPNALWTAQKLIKDNPRTRHPKYWAGWFLLSN